MLKEAIYPSLLCAAAREGDIDKLKELQLNASACLNKSNKITLHSSIKLMRT